MRVLQLIDTLNAGGAERVAVNIANALTLEVDKSFICTTREEGSLKQNIDKKVGYIFLNKRSTLDFKAIFKLRRFIKEQNINIVHAHSTSFFLSSIMKLLMKNLIIIWHDHYGNSEFLDKRPLRILKFCSRNFSHIFCVNRNLEKWDRQYLRCKSVSYLQNFAVNTFIEPITNMLGVSGKRVLCLANLRPQKDHVTLLKAFKIVHQRYTDCTLHCVGQDFNDNYSKHVYSLINVFGLQKNLFFYGSKSDVTNIINQCDIGVLSSESEGLPLALLEYGLGGLPVVITNVGDCARVVTNNKSGIIVNKKAPEELALGIIRIFEDNERAKMFGENLRNKIEDEYSQKIYVQDLIVNYNSFK